MSWKRGVSFVIIFQYSCVDFAKVINFMLRSTICILFVLFFIIVLLVVTWNFQLAFLFRKHDYLKKWVKLEGKDKKVLLLFHGFLVVVVVSFNWLLLAGVLLNDEKGWTRRWGEEEKWFLIYWIWGGTLMAIIAVCWIFSFNLCIINEQKKNIILIKTKYVVFSSSLFYNFSVIVSVVYIFLVFFFFIYLFLVRIYYFNKSVYRTNAIYNSIHWFINK